MKDKKQYYIYQMNINILNIVSVILLIFFIALVALIDKDFLITSVEYLYTGLNFVVFMILYIFYMILHELIHSIAYVLMGAKYDRVIYGAALEKGVLYCLCKQNVSKKNILTSLASPFITIGILTFMLSIIIESPYLLFLSIFNLSGCAGDIIMFLFISRLDSDIEFTEFDDPISFGLYSSKDITKKNHFGLNYITKCNEVNRNDLEKIKISKFSKIFFIVLIMILILVMICSKL